MHLIKGENKLFYLLTILGFIALLFSNPFLRYPYDMIHHLIIIDDIYEQLINPVQKLTGISLNNIYFMVPTEETEPLKLARPRYLWHYIWAEFFIWLDINSTHLILRAKIIHVLQIIISLASIYYFSHVILRNIFKYIEIIQLRWLSVWSVLIWVTIFATFSTAYHQVWIMWYSINYQITLPLFWYMLGLTLVLLLEQKSWKIKLFFIFQIIVLSRFILQVHSMEFMYYLMYITIFCFIFIDKVYLLLKKYFYIIIPIIITIIFMAKRYQPEKSLIFKYISLEKIPELYNKIMESGAILLSGYNRAFSSINELIYLILFLGIIFIFYIFWYKYKQKNINIQMRVLFFILLTSMFIIIPLYQFSAGLFGVMTHPMIVNRLYYSSSLFILIPIFFYTMFHKLKPKYLHLFIASCLILITFFSKYNDILHHNYYKNILSIKNSFAKQKVGFNLTQSQIDTIKQKLDSYEKQNKSNKKIYYYARSDIAFVIKYLFHKNVYWKDRRTYLDYIKIYEQNKNNIKYKNILFNVPKEFPLYDPYT